MNILQNNKRLIRLPVLFAVLILSSIPAFAEKFQITLKGEALKNVAAVEIALSVTPPESLKIDKAFLSNTKTLFKTVDQKHGLIRVLLAETISKDLSIEGKLNRINFKGEAKAAIKDIKFIAKLGKEIEEGSIVGLIDIQKEDEILPFMGIVKGKILGPAERIFQNEMFIAITEIETYGFDFNKTVKNVKINGTEAKFLNGEIVAANLELAEMPYDNELEIILELEVQDKLIKKTIGRINLLESIK